MNRYQNYHANERLHQQSRKKKQSKHAEFGRMYQNSGCTFNYERLGVYIS